MIIFVASFGSSIRSTIVYFWSSQTTVSPSTRVVESTSIPPPASEPPPPVESAPYQRFDEPFQVRTCPLVGVALTLPKSLRLSDLGSNWAPSVCVTVASVLGVAEKPEPSIGAVSAGSE